MINNTNESLDLRSNEINLEKETQKISLKVKNSQEVMAIAKQIDIKSTDSIMNFGRDVASEISSFADQILNTIETTKLENSGELLIQLNKIMDKFDAKDFQDKKPSFFSKLFNKAKNSIDALFQKYHTMGGEVDKVYIKLKQYEGEINTSNNNLDEMFSKTMDYYTLLEEYICAGNLVTDNFKNDILPQLENKAASSQEQIDQMNLSNANELLQMLEQRIYDLELAKNVALQTMPQIKMIQQGNYNLVRKINSAFIVTIPIFKQSLIQAITLKRQAIQSKAMAALDEKTNELLLKNAQNTALQSKMTAKLASGSSIKIETLEKTWQTIVQGIDETKQIENEARQNRIDGKKRLEAIQRDFESKIKKN